MVVEYAPTTVGSHSSSLSMSYNNGTESRTASQTLTGESVAQAILSKSETGSFDFGATTSGSVLDKTITLFNAGGSTATSLAFSFDSSTFGFKGGAFPGTGGTCSTQMAAGSNCTIVIQFRPQSLGNHSGVMTMNYHDGLRTQTDLLDLKGTGT